MRRKVTNIFTISTRVWLTVTAVLHPTVNASVLFKRSDVNSHLVPYSAIRDEKDIISPISMLIHIVATDDKSIWLNATESGTESSESIYHDYENEREDRRAGGQSDEHSGGKEETGSSSSSGENHVNAGGKIGNGDGGADDRTWQGNGGGGGAGYEDTYNATFTESAEVYTTHLSTRISSHHTTSRPWVTTGSIFSDDSDNVSCDFGIHPEHTWCGWTNSDTGTLKWQVGSGRSANWLGGPTNDLSSDNVDGGFLFVETSEIPPPQAWNLYSGAVLQSALLGNTGPQGRCISFGYIMDGLSPAELKVLLRPTNETKEKESVINEVTTTNTDALDMVLWKAEFHTHGLWRQAEFLYTHEYPHKIMFEAISVDITDASRLYRGFIALDSIKQSPALGELCHGFCTFASGFCDWTNEEEEDDFDWTLARGSRNPVTGPATDCKGNSGTGGGYTFIDSGYPRRPGDRARLYSLQFPPTDLNSPLCMRFWFHMFGPAVGTLRVLLKPLTYSRDSSETREIWKMSGSAGNSWFTAQVTVSDIHDFQIIFEAQVGITGMSDIAIDDITYIHGPCPVEPQVAATQHGDCTFEVDECSWLQKLPENDKGVLTGSSITWERISAQQTKDQQRVINMAQSQGNVHYLNLGRKLLHPRGVRALLVSREFSGTKGPLCMTFWYLMHEPFIHASGPSLGTLKLLLETAANDVRPIWQLSNNQGPSWNLAQVPISVESNFKVVFEGMWGPNRASGSIALDDITFYVGECTLKPRQAHIQSEDCSFEFDLCGWKNMTRMHNNNQKMITWQMASEIHRPAQLSDRTFGTSGGYIFFDIFTTNQQPNEVYLFSGSMNIDGYDAICFTFWYAAFGASESTHLHILMIPFGSEMDLSLGAKMWSMTAKESETARPSWNSGQFPVTNVKWPFVLVLQGKASNGGFAVDDIRSLPGSCKVRPEDADPAT